MAYKQNKISRSRRPKVSRPLYMAVATVVLIALVVTGLEVTNTTHIFHSAPLAKKIVISTTSPKKTTTTTTTPATSNTSPNIPVPATTPTSSKDTVDGSSSTPATTTTTTTTAALMAPEGTFVSNHEPDISGNPYPNTEASVCTTTPGATCGMTFTMGDITRTLPTQTVDGSGSTSWSWSVTGGTNGFSPGKWQISVTATLNGQTKTVQDPTPLTVGS